MSSYERIGQYWGGLKGFTKVTFSVFFSIQIYHGIFNIDALPARSPPEQANGQKIRKNCFHIFAGKKFRVWMTPHKFDDLSIQNVALKAIYIAGNDIMCILILLAHNVYSMEHV